MASVVKRQLVFYSLGSPDFRVLFAGAEVDDDTQTVRELASDIRSQLMGGAPTSNGIARLTQAEIDPGATDVVVALSDDLGLDDALALPIVTPGGALRRAARTLGLPLDGMGLILDGSLPTEAHIAAELQAGDTEHQYTALSRVSRARALMLYSFAFVARDQQGLAERWPRPVILLRDCVIADVALFLESHARPIREVAEVSSAMRSDTRLTPREQQVVDQLMRGRSSKEIGGDLEISPRTVDIYRASILKKMRAKNTPQLLYLLRTQGMPH